MQKEQNGMDRENNYDYDRGISNMAQGIENTQGKSYNKRVCPRCGSDDLLYETVQKKSNSHTLLKVILVVVFIVVLGSVGIFAFFALTTLAIVIGVITGGIKLFKSSDVARNIGIEQEGDLRVTCKRCGKQINIYNMIRQEQLANNTSKENK